MIQLRSTSDVARGLVRFLSASLSSRHALIYLWKEDQGSFSAWPVRRGIQEHFPLIDPFLLHMTEHPQVYERHKSISRQDMHQEAERFFKATASTVLIPLVINESLVGVICLAPDQNRRLGASDRRLIEEMRSLAVMSLSNSLLYARLEGILGSLEEKVRERTQELEDAQTQLIQSEKMASLGVMVAGIAHEINTPAGVIQAATENIEKNLSFILAHLADLRREPREIQPAQERLLYRMEKLIGQDNAAVKDLFRKKMETTKVLEAQGIRPAKEIASLIAENGIELDEGVLTDLQTAFKADHDPSGFYQFLLETANSARNLRNLRNAIRSIVRIVKALKSYSHLDAGRFEGAEIHDSIENTLVLLDSVLKNRVHLERKYAQVPPVFFNPDQMAQVWTNLIQNASQAMRGQEDARIEIETQSVELGGLPAVRITIRDNGPGILPEVQARIWDPFFTTKDQGEGTGLGLSIVRNIIQRHQGRIDVETAPGQGAAFHITLPLMPGLPDSGHGEIYKFSHQ
jgi:two-component system NtrC family sensor kinase